MGEREHRGAGHPPLEDPHQVLVGGDLIGRRREPELPLPEVPRPGVEEPRRRPVAAAVLAMAGRAVSGVELRAARARGDRRRALHRGRGLADGRLGRPGRGRRRRGRSRAAPGGTDQGESRRGECEEARGPGQGRPAGGPTRVGGGRGPGGMLAGSARGTTPIDSEAGGCVHREGPHIRLRLVAPRDPPVTNGVDRRTGEDPRGRTPVGRGAQEKPRPCDGSHVGAAVADADRPVASRSTHLILSKEPAYSGHPAAIKGSGGGFRVEGQRAPGIRNPAIDPLPDDSNDAIIGCLGPNIRFFVGMMP